jgi:carboxyl-terminal processing protease
MLPSDADRPSDPPPDAAPASDPQPGSSQPDEYRIQPVAVAGAPRRRLPVLSIAIALVAVLAGAALFMSGYSLGRHQGSEPGTPPTQDAAFQPFWDAYHTIVERYAGGTVDQKKLIEGAIKGMIDALGDPYSSYLTPEDYKATLQGISGQFEGIGAEIGTQNGSGKTSDCTTLGTDCRLVVIAPIDGSPAQKAGMKAGDVVVKVDGASIDGLTVEGARDKIRGKKGTTVAITVERNGTQQELSIVRDVIVQKEVTTKDLAGGSVGYIRLAGFSDTAADDVANALKQDVAAGKKKIILDLRGNPGGFVTAARKVASQFIADGPIFWQEDARGNQVATTAEPGGAATDESVKLVVLIDRGSASASEIVAGAIQDRKRGTIVGETSFGKGTVQQWTPLDGDAGGFKLTVAKWLTPDKRWIHHVGIVPDVKVDSSNAAAGKDPALDKALEVLGAASASALLRVA